MVFLLWGFDHSIHFENYIQQGFLTLRFRSGVPKLFKEQAALAYIHEGTSRTKIVGVLGKDLRRKLISLMPEMKMKTEIKKRFSLEND